jgi:hypothetical protein
MDMIGLVGLIVGIIGLFVAIAALWVAIHGIRDVRRLMRELITMERNRMMARMLNGAVHRFVNLNDEVSRLHAGAADKHEFTMLVRHLQPDLSMEDALAYANHEALTLAQEMVRLGHAAWKEDIDGDKVGEVTRDWQGQKNAAVLKSIFGDSQLLAGDPGIKMVKD